MAFSLCHSERVTCGSQHSLQRIMPRYTYIVHLFLVETYLFHGCDQRRVLPAYACDYKRETLSVVTLERSEITGTYNTPSGRNILVEIETCQSP